MWWDRIRMRSLPARGLGGLNGSCQLLKSELEVQSAVDIESCMDCGWQVLWSIADDFAHALRRLAKLVVSYAASVTISNFLCSTFAGVCWRFLCNSLRAVPLQPAEEHQNQ